MILYQKRTENPLKKTRGKTYVKMYGKSVDFIPKTYGKSLEKNPWKNVRKNVRKKPVGKRTENPVKKTRLFRMYDVIECPYKSQRVGVCFIQQSWPTGAIGAMM